MADVVVSVGEHTLRREEQGIILQISNSGATVGKLVISKGGLRWLGANEKEKGGHHFASWSQFADFMDGQPRK